MATSSSPLIRCILSAVAIAGAAASNDSSQGAALRGAAAVDLAEPRRAQEVQGGFQQPVQGEGGVVQGGAVQGGDMQGGGVSTQFPDLKAPDILPDWLNHLFTAKGYLARFVMLMIVGFFYWCCIVSQYPKLMGPSHTSARLQSENELNATCQASFANCIYSYLCSQDAESLDMATGARTKCCGVEQAPDFHSGMYPGGGMPPQHNMHHGHHEHHGHHQQQGFMVNPQGSYGYGQGYPMQQY